MRALVSLALLGIAHSAISSARAEPAARVSQTDAVLAGLIQQSLASACLASLTPNSAMLPCSANFPGHGKVWEAMTDT